MEFLTLAIDGDQVIARLRGDLSFGTARELHNQLLRLFNAYHHIKLEIVELGTLDLAGIQILYAAQASARQQGLDFVFEPGPARERITRLLDFAGLPSLVGGKHGI